MRLEKLRRVDLNLLITFAAIAEEKSVTAAASRLFEYSSAEVAGRNVRMLMPSPYREQQPP